MNPTSVDSNFLMWTVVVGFFTPVVVALIQQEHWSDILRAIVTFVFCIIVALGDCFFQGKLNAENYNAIITSFLVILVTAIATYKGLWQPTNIAPKIEHLTSGVHVEVFHQKMALRAA